MRPPTVALVLMLLASPAAAQLSEPHVVRDSATPCLNVRPEPDTDAEPDTCIPPGTQVTVIASVPYWREIRLANDSTGWAAKKFLEPIAVEEPSGPLSIPADAFLEVHFVDVGQGDAIWIHTYDDGVDGNGRFEGRNIVIDGGPQSSDNTNQFRFYLEERAHHDAVIDAAILTHPHDDHYPGLDGIRRHFDVLRYYDPGFPKGGVEYPAYLAAMEAETVAGGAAIESHIGFDQFGDLDYLGDEIEAEFLYSWPGASNDNDLGSGSDLENNASIVLRLKYGEHVFLFMGDAEGKARSDTTSTARYVERRLLDQYPDSILKATVLKAGHHGSETSSTAEFIDAVDPEIVVMQSGRRPYSGRTLPDAGVLQRFCTHNPATRIYRTDQNDEAEGLTTSNDEDGDHIVIRTNGDSIVVEALEGGAAFTPSGC